MLICIINKMVRTRRAGYHAAAAEVVHASMLARLPAAPLGGCW
ncbi:MAG TPA: hypothetical protein VN494_01140 [Patescibacteria group bacterium]|nr:hypothetical protein [Patescibacteria group bacterium]